MVAKFVAGAGMGAVVSGVGVLVALAVLPPVELSEPQPESGEVSVPAGSAFNAERPDTAPVLPSTESRPTAASVPLPEVEIETPAPALETGTVARPTTGTAEDTLPAPSSGAAETQVIVSEDSGVSTLPGTPQPTEPKLETVPSPDEPAAADVGEVETAALQDLAEAAPVPEVVQPADAQPAAPKIATPTAPAEETAPSVDVAVEDAPVPSPGSGALTTPQIALDTPSLPRVGVDDGPTLPSIGTIGSGGGEDALPNIGTNPETPADIAALPAIQRFAEAFEPSTENPKLAIILLDGPLADGLDLAVVSVPVAVAVDPLLPNARSRSAELRAAGIEVLALASLADGASPADVEVAFQSFFEDVNQAVGVMDLPSAIIQGSRPRAAQVVEILKASGHGLVTYNKGLNAALQIAEREGVPAAKVTRVFDDGTGDTGKLTRGLDQGAFRAGQEGNSLMIGWLRPETIAALAKWSVSSRAETIELAPVSAVLLDK